MNEQKTAILVDSGCDIPAELCQELDIRVLPLRVMYPEKDYWDGVDIDPMMVYERFPDEFPSTSTPTLAEAQAKLEEIRDEGFERVIAVCISSGLSSTYNAIRLASAEVEGLKTLVFDTKNISIGSGLFAIWAARKLKEGWTAKQVVTGMRRKLPESKVFFYMDTLTYLRRGGRIGRVAGALGEVLKLKPIISCDEDGTYYTVAKIRGSKFGKLRLLEEVVSYCHGHKCWIVVEEGCAHEEALAMQEMIERNIPDATILFEKQITATMAINTGPGLVGVAIFRDPNELPK